MSCEARAFSQPPRSDASQAYSGCSGTCNSERCRPSARLAATTCTTWHPTPPAATPTCAPAAGPRPAPTAAAAGSAAAATEQRLPPLPAASWRSYAYRTERMKTTGRAPARARTPAAVRNFCNHFAVYMPLTSPQRGLTCQWRRGRFLRLLQFPRFHAPSSPLLCSAALVGVRCAIHTCTSSLLSACRPTSTCKLTPTTCPHVHAACTPGYHPQPHANCKLSLVSYGSLSVRWQRGTEAAAAAAQAQQGAGGISGRRGAAVVAGAVAGRLLRGLCAGVI